MSSPSSLIIEPSSGLQRKDSRAKSHRSVREQHPQKSLFSRGAYKHLHNLRHPRFLRLEGHQHIHSFPVLLRDRLNLSASPKDAMSKIIESPKARCLTDLPNELLMRIFSFIPHDSHWLAPLCRVSRHFQTVVEPQLYSIITLSDESIPEWKIFTSGDGSSNIPKFFCLVNTLSKYPLLREHPQELWLKIGHRGGHWKGRAGYYPSLSFQRLLFELLPSLQDLHLKPPPMFSEVPVMPSLRSLHLDFEAVYARTEYIDTDKSERDIRLGQYRTFKNSLMIPTLRVLKVVGLTLLSSDIPLVEFPKFGHRSSPINDLQLFRCKIFTLDVFTDILTSICTLKRLVLDCEWQHLYRGDSLPSYDNLDRALHPHRSHLEELIIAGDHYMPYENTKPMGSLAHYVALKRLASPAHLLNVHDGITMQRAIECLPQHLEELQLQDRTYVGYVGTDMALDMDMRVPLQQNLAAIKATSLPALKRVIWWYLELPKIPVEEVFPFNDMKALGSLFRSIGVDFECGWSSNFQFTPLGEPFKDGNFFGGSRSSCSFGDIAGWTGTGYKHISEYCRAELDEGLDSKETGQGMKIQN